jgi:hypothetical protein
MRFLCVVVCLIIAVVYFFVRPGWKGLQGAQRHRSLWFKFILRWFHSLTWVLFAAACFLRAKLPAAFAAGVYLTFLVTLVHERGSRRKV